MKSRRPHWTLLETAQPAPPQINILREESHLFSVDDANAFQFISLLYAPQCCDQPTSCPSRSSPPRIGFGLRGTGSPQPHSSPPPPTEAGQRRGKPAQSVWPSFRLGQFWKETELEAATHTERWRRHHLPPPGSPCALNSLNRPRSSRYMRLMVVAARALMPGMNSWSCRTAESRSTSEPSESLGSSEESFASESLADSTLLSSSSAGSNLGAGWGKLD